LIELAVKANRLGCVKGTSGYRLHQRPFLKLPTLVDPAPVFGPDLLAISETGIGLQHHRGRRFEHDPLGFIFGLFETGTGQLGTKALGAFLVPFHCANKVFHCVR